MEHVTEDLCDKKDRGRNARQGHPSQFFFVKCILKERTHLRVATQAKNRVLDAVLAIIRLRGPR